MPEFMAAEEENTTMPEEGAFRTYSPPHLSSPSSDASLQPSPSFPQPLPPPSTSPPPPPPSPQAQEQGIEYYNLTQV
ncbi:sulfated surface glycoprotein 185-like isoform X2 [Morus notabilis]|uniref:sulfated surface glycoprotein 185-like isoform X2 n=1 Tax=Morus notabilis TaxID=981085 RepID=UPI000CECE795|nr:sulfated surface glycoprotein 185-like isoform X2 [Morus notabilis]